MDTKVNDPGPVAAPRRTAPAQQATVPVGAVAAPPEKVETPQAVPAADTAQKAAIGPAAPTSALTTYKDQDSGRSEEHTSELQSLMRISYAVFCLKKKTKPA